MLFNMHDKEAADSHKMWKSYPKIKIGLDEVFFSCKILSRLVALEAKVSVIMK